MLIVKENGFEITESGQLCGRTMQKKTKILQKLKAKISKSQNNHHLV